ncbi:AAA domain-containing protein, partial [Desulfobotulus alkaliphilus]
MFFKTGNIAVISKNGDNPVCLLFKITVCFKKCILKEKNKGVVVIPFGGWYDEHNKKYGAGLWSLYSYVTGKDMTKAMDIIQKYGDSLSSHKFDDDKRKRWCRQIKVPLKDHDFFLFDIFEGNPCEVLTYYTSSGIKTEEVQFWKLSDKLIVPVYYTLWAFHDNRNCFSQMQFPEKPYSLYNLHLLPKNPQEIYVSNIIFVSDEMEADRLAKQAFSSFSGGSHDKAVRIFRKKNIGCDFDKVSSGTIFGPEFSPYVFTTCFNGFAGIKDADLSPLEGNSIRLYLQEDSPDVKHLPEAIKSLKKAGCSEILVKIGNLEFVEADEYLKNIGRGKEVQGLIDVAPAAKGLATIKNRSSGSNIKRKTLIDPIIKEGDLVVIYGEEKTFKSWFGYSLAYALGVGNHSIARWNSGEPLRVLYVDGELYEDECKERIEKIMAAAGNTSEDYPFETFLRMDAKGENFDISLESEEWQEKIEDALGDYDVLFFDSLYSLIKNDVHSAVQVFGWFRRLGVAGKTVIVLDHSNKEGDVQGGRVKERAANLVMNVALFSKGSSRIMVSFPHTRNLSPEDSAAFDLDMILTDDAFSMEVMAEAKQEVPPLS